jgi:hypothetical protein
VFAELGAQPAGLNAHHGIDLGIEIGLAPEDFGSDLVFLQWNPGVFESVVGKITQQLAQGFGTVKCLAGDEPVNFSQDLGSWRHSHPSNSEVTEAYQGPQLTATARLMECNSIRRNETYGDR